jgi:hypothetical protein
MDLFFMLLIEFNIALYLDASNSNRYQGTSAVLSNDLGNTFRRNFFP